MNPALGCARHLLEHTLEQLAFAPSTPILEDFDWAGPGVEWAEVPLVAPLRGTLVFGAAGGTLDGLATDAWGPEAGGDVARTFLAEVANILAGRLVGALHPDAEPVIGLPISGEGLPPVAGSAHEICLDVDGGRVGLLLVLPE